MDPVKVLVVDDDESLRSIIRISLAAEPDIGEVREASDGEAAVQVCEEFEPDVVILDYWMPVMDGADAAGKIRSLHPSAQIVAYSSALDSKPEWADAILLKDSIPDPDYVIDLARLEKDPPPAG